MFDPHPVESDPNVSRMAEQDSLLVRFYPFREECGDGALNLKPNLKLNQKPNTETKSQCSDSPTMLRMDSGPKQEAKTELSSKCQVSSKCRFRSTLEIH